MDSSEEGTGMNQVYDNGSKCTEALILGQTFLCLGPVPGISDRDSKRTENPPAVYVGRWPYTQNDL